MIINQFLENGVKEHFIKLIARKVCINSYYN